jgi:hypothetical protein
MPFISSVVCDGNFGTVLNSKLSMPFAQNLLIRWSSMKKNEPSRLLDLTVRPLGLTGVGADAGGLTGAGADTGAGGLTDADADADAGAGGLTDADADAGACGLCGLTDAGACGLCGLTDAGACGLCAGADVPTGACGLCAGADGLTGAGGLTDAAREPLPSSSFLRRASLVSFLLALAIPLAFAVALRRFFCSLFLVFLIFSSVEALISMRGGVFSDEPAILRGF